MASIRKEVLIDGLRRRYPSGRGRPGRHHNASVQVFADGERRSRVVWIADVLPHEIAAYMAGCSIRAWE